MFYYNESLNKVIFLEGFNTENVIFMFSMFAFCSSLTDLNLSKFNTGEVVNIRYMFVGCKKLEKLNLSSFDEANSLEGLNEMFKGCNTDVELITLNKEINEEIDKVRNKKT